MPRIAAAIGVFATVAVFTFINIKTYPVVWEMVGTAPWFAQGGESSQQETAAQAKMAAEEEVKEAAPSRSNPSRPVSPLPKLKSLAGSDSLESDIPAKPTGFGPRLDLVQKSASDSQADSLAGNAAQDNGPSSDSSLRTGTAATSGEGAYPGLNLGPIKITETVSEAAGADNSVLGKMTAAGPPKSASAALPAPSGSRWPAEMSPRMKYAAKPPTLETYQNWNPERPLVPVQRPKETQKSSTNKQGKSAKDASPDHKDSSRFKRPVEMGNGFGKAIVRHLPPVDPKDRPIRMSIPAHGPNSPIPVYPGTGR